MKYLPLLVAAFFISSCEFDSSSQWYLSKTRKPAITQAQVVEVDVFDSKCSDLYTNNLRGCYIPEQCDPLYPGMTVFCIPGRIEIAERMTPWERDCVIKHERRHEQGYDHPPKWSDCW